MIDPALVLVLVLLLLMMILNGGGGVDDVEAIHAHRCALLLFVGPPAGDVQPAPNPNPNPRPALIRSTWTAYAQIVQSHTRHTIVR